MAAVNALNGVDLGAIHTKSYHLAYDKDERQCYPDHDKELLIISETFAGNKKASGPEHQSQATVGEPSIKPALDT